MKNKVYCHLLIQTYFQEYHKGNGFTEEQRVSNLLYAQIELKSILKIVGMS